jgi:hypothetical protein
MLRTKYDRLAGPAEFGVVTVQSLRPQWQKSKVDPNGRKVR